MRVTVGKAILDSDAWPYRLQVGCETAVLNEYGMRTIAREVLAIIGDEDKSERLSNSYREIERLERRIRSLKGALTRAKRGRKSR